MGLAPAPAGDASSGLFVAAGDGLRQYDDFLSPRLRNVGQPQWQSHLAGCS